MPMPAIPGGRYTAERNADGTWNVLDVPIFGENSRFEQTIDERWLKAALKRAQTRYEQDQYIAPLHLGHHKPGGPSTVPAGFVMPTRVARGTYEGKEIALLYANLLQVPAEVYEEIRRGRLPYRSIEMANPDEPEIFSCALMSDEVPWFRLPLLTIGDERHAAVVTKTLEGYAYARKGRACAYLYRFADDMGQAKKDDEKDEEEPEEEAPADEQKKPEGQMSEGNPVLDAIGVLGQKVDQLVTILTNLCGGGAPGAPAATPGMGTPAGATKTGAPAEFQAKKEAKNMDPEAKAKLDAMEGRVNMLEAEKRVSGMVAKAMDDLKAFSRPDSLPKTLAELAGTGDQEGQKRIDAYVTAYKTAAVPAPPPRGTADSTQGSDHPAEVLAYSARGPEAVTMMAKHASDWKALGHRAGMSLKEYLSAQETFIAIGGRRVNDSN